MAERLADQRNSGRPRLDDAAIKRWVGRDPALHALPLYTMAAAIHTVLEPAETFGLSGAQIITALVERERRRLDAAGRNAGWGEHAASRLSGLAALRNGLDTKALHRLATPQLEIGLPPPELVVDAARSLGWWEGDRIPAPSPDLVAAELLRQILQDRPDMAPEWIWEALNDETALELGRLNRLALDTVVLHDPAENMLRDGLMRALDGRRERAVAWQVFLHSDELGFRLSPVGVAVGNALLTGPSLSEEQRAAVLNNLSARRSEAGDTNGALAAIREAVEIFRRLAQEVPARFVPELARSLHNLSIALRDAGHGAHALIAIQEALKIRRGLARENPARFEVALADSLNSSSVLLSDAGNAVAALAAINEVVTIFCRLEEENPGRFVFRVAGSLHNLSLRLRDTGDLPGALAAIRKAIGMRRRLAQDEPARFASDLASSLNILSNRLSETGDVAGALEANSEALEMYRRLAEEIPARFVPDLAGGLINRSNRLGEVGDDSGARLRFTRQ